MGLSQGQVRETEKTTKNSRFPWSQCSNFLFEFFRNKYITRTNIEIIGGYPFFPTRVSFLFWCQGIFFRNSDFISWCETEFEDDNEKLCS